MDLSSLVGKTIIHRDPVTNGSDGRAVVMTKWIVVAAYPHYVMAERTCENGYIYRECFNIGTLICEGIIRQKGVDHDYIGN